MEENMKNKIDVIIPSAILVPNELQTIGKLPGIIYPINQKIVFDYLYEQYKDINGKIYVICYEAKEKIHTRLSSYKDKKIIVKDLEVLNDLGHTLYYSLENIKNPVIINFADTIIMDDVLDNYGDIIFYSEKSLSEVWTFFDIENGKIKAIYDKQKSNINKKKKVFVGLFQITNPEYFRNCLEKAFKNKDLKISTFYYALSLYSQMYQMNTKKIENWFDIGHADTYNASNLQVKAREFNHIIVDKDRGILRKTSDDKDKFIGEILWYLKLPADIEYVRPRIFSYSTNYENPYVSMEYYAYHTLHELFLNADLTYSQWKDIFKRIKFVCNDFSRYSLKDEKIVSSIKEMYLDKTIQRMEKLGKDDRFSNFFTSEIVINNTKYKSLNDVIDMLKNVIPELLYDVDVFNIIHGDLCFANIMIDNNFSFIKVIDPRGKFGSFDIYGDVRYELAKLFHSIDGKYDYIIKDLFEIDFDLDKCNINFEIKERKRDFDIYKLFLSIFEDSISDIKKIELIESLLFLSMIPLHNESLEHQLAMLATGLEILDRVIDIKF